VQHTSASLIIQENADPDVVHDLMSSSTGWSRRTTGCIVTVEGRMTCRPTSRGAHAAQLSVPVERGRMALGNWQASTCLGIAPRRTPAHQAAFARRRLTRVCDTE